MQTTQLSNDACQLTFLKFSNCYLVREDSGFTVIDTSIGGHAEEIVAQAKSLGGQIGRILLTHAHGDHIGSLDALHNLCGEVGVAISEREAPLLHKEPVAAARRAAAEAEGRISRCEDATDAHAHRG